MINCRVASPPWRGEFRRLNTLDRWGGFREQNDEGCDARKDKQDY